MELIEFLLVHPSMLAVSLYIVGCVGFFVLMFLFMEELKEPSEPYVQVYLACLAVAAFWPVWTMLLSALLLVALPFRAIVRLKKPLEGKKLGNKIRYELDELPAPDFLQTRDSQTFLKIKAPFLVKTKKLDLLLIRYEAVLVELQEKKNRLNDSIEDFEKSTWSNFVNYYSDQIKGQFNDIASSQVELNEIYDDFFQQIEKTWLVDKRYYRESIHGIYNKYDHLNFLTPDEYDLKILPGGRIFIEHDQLRDLFLSDGERLKVAPNIAFPKKIKSEWKVIITKNFYKGMKKINTGLQERFFTALEAILVDPVMPIGSAKKPLGNNKSGLWRYRLGDVRIVYEPDTAHKQIVFLEIGHRSRIYAG